MTSDKIYLYTGRNMPRSSTAQLSQETITELENQFYNFLDSLSYDEKKQFFNEFLTNEEKMMMYKRLGLYWCLLEGYPLAKIQQMIGVTHDTTRVYNKKKNTLSPEFKSLIKRIEGSKQTEEQAPQQEETQSMEPAPEEAPHQELAQEEQQAPEQQYEQPQEQQFSPQEETPTESSTENVWQEHTEQTGPQQPEASFNADVPAPQSEPQPEQSFTTDEPASSEPSRSFEHETPQPTEHEHHSSHQFEQEKEIVHPLDTAFEPETSHETAPETPGHPSGQPEMTTRQPSEDTPTPQETDSQAQTQQEEQKEKKKSGLAKFFGF